MTKTYLTREQMFLLGDLIRQHCHRNEDGFAVYDAPWTDELILKQVGSPYNINHVAHLRKELCGKFPPTTNILNQYQLKDYILELTKRVDGLQAKLDKIEHWARQRPRTPFGEIIP
jgi:hypothetical protein